MEIKDFGFLNSVFKEVGPKSTYVWTMGTDFLLHLSRWSNLLLELKEKINIENEIFFVQKFVEFKNEQPRYMLQVLEKVKSLESDEEVFDEKVIDTYTLVGSGNTKYFLTNNGISRGNSTWRQFFYIANSLGIIYRINESKWGLNIIPSNLMKVNNEKEALDFSIKYLSNSIDGSFQQSNSKKECLRDIYISIYFAFYIAKYSVYNFVEHLLKSNVKVINFRNKKDLTFVNKNDVEFIKQLSKHSNIEEVFGVRGTQTLIMNNYQNDQLISFVNMIEEKFINNYINNSQGWNVNDISQQELLLLTDSIKNNKRPKQGEWKRRLNFSYKRSLGDSYYSSHDVVNDVKNFDLTIGCHILDYKYCTNDNEKYDPENGLLLDPTIHHYYDKDIIVIDEEGNFYIKKSYYGELEKLLSNEVMTIRKIREEILTPKTKEYIKKRNIQHNIVFEDEFIRIK